MKICFKCLKKKSINKFYVHSQMKDGHLNKCIDCSKQDVHRHRLMNIEKIIEYDRNRPNRLERNVLANAYRKTQKGKEIAKKAVAKWKKNNPEQNRVRWVVGNMVRDGYLEKLPCQICGDNKSQGHHEDYSLPLDVIWLCNYHHVERHKQLRRMNK